LLIQVTNRKIYNPTDKNYISKLDHLIELQNVNDHVKRIAAYAGMKKDLEESDTVVSVPIVKYGIHGKLRNGKYYGCQNYGRDFLQNQFAVKR